MKKWLIHLVPWLITCIALYFAARDVNVRDIIRNFYLAQPFWIVLAVALTLLSYLLRARRWQHLYPQPTISWTDSTKVLLLGFFMNNILPARTGEFVRAHLGAQATGETRTLVLATIASERLTDGLMLSLMFVIFAFGMGDQEYSQNLFYVAVLFAAAAAFVVITLALRAKVFTFADKLSSKMGGKTSTYTLNRLQVFINGLVPLCTWSKLPVICIWTIVVWFTELGVYIAICEAFGASLSVSHSVLFLVAVNFSSLIPAAPGGIGVIEAVASHVLVSTGVGKALALSMVVSQHCIQYIVVGIPGILVMLSWREQIRRIKESRNERETAR